MQGDKIRERIDNLLKTNDVDKITKDLNLKFEDYQGLIDALEYIQALPNEQEIQKNLDNAFHRAPYSLTSLGGLYNLYDAIGCELIHRGEMKYFDILVRAGYLNISTNTIHCALVLNRNSIYKVIELTAPEVISSAIHELLSSESVRMMVITRYFSDDKYKDAVKEGIERFKSEI